MRTTINVDKLVVYKYNYDKKENVITRVKCYAEKSQSNSELLNVIEDSSRTHRTVIKKADIGDISKSFGNPIYLAEVNDTLAEAHFKWAAEQKIQEAKEAMAKYIEIKRTITGNIRKVQ